MLSLDPVPWGKQRIDVIYVKAPEFSAPEIHVLVGVPALSHSNRP